LKKLGLPQISDLFVPGGGGVDRAGKKDPTVL
jgi:hypothetical protein